MKAGKIKMLIAILCVIVCIVAIFATIASASGSIVTDAEMAAIKNAFGDYLVQDTRRVEDDGYVGAVQYTAYYDKAKGNVTPGIGGTPTILYVINTNTERVGTLSDIEIIQSMLDRGYVVVVVDYLDNVKATGHKLDDSAQVAAQNVRYGRWLDKVAPLSTEKNGNYHETFVCPAGHDVLLNQVFWEIDKHSADGTLEKIVENWNTDFKGTKAERLVKWAAGDTVDTRKKVANDKDGNAPVWYNASGAVDANGVYTKVKFTVAETITDCVNPDGSPLAMDMLLNLVYPTNPKNEVPVLTVSSCWGYPTNTNQCYTDLCSHHTGALFRGYAGAIYDYLWHPMARDDSFGYYDGNLNTTGAVTGDHMNYSIHLYNDKLINTAAIRYLRYLALSDGETYKFDLDAFATIGLSKGAWFSFLGEEVLQSALVDASKYSGDVASLETAIDLELASFTNKRIFEGHHGETRYQAGNTTAVEGGVYTGAYAIEGGEKQPWLTYGGVEIVSGVQLTYAANGSQQEDISKGHSPIFAAAHMNDEYNAAYGSANEIQNIAKSLDIPLVFFEVDQLHEYAYFPDMFYGVETYDAFFDFANYYLKKAPVKVLYTDPYKNDGDISLTDKIVVQFSGAVTAEQIVKVTVTASGETLTGTWESLYGGTQWIFTSDNMKGGTEYTITVPTDITGDNGVAMGTAYTSTFITENAEDTELTSVDGTYTFTAPATLSDGMDSYVFRFTVSNDAANVAELYDGNDSLIGSVNLRGVGTYEIDITDYVCENAGQEITLTLKTASSAAVTVLEERDFSSATNIGTYSQAPSSIVKLDENGNEVETGDSAFKIYIKDNSGTYGGGDVHYENLANVLALQKLLGTNSVTKSDYGRQINVTVRFFDTDSRTIQFKMWGMTSTALGVMDYDQPIYNITTKAGEWMTVTIPYVVYETDYGHTGNNTQSLFVRLSPSGNTNKPIYFTHATIEETVTDVTVTNAYLSAKNLGKAPYKAPSSESFFTIYNGEEAVGNYSGWNSALNSYVSGYTLKLNANYTLTDSELYGDFGAKFENVIIDLNGYDLRLANSSNSLIWAKNTSTDIAKTSITLKNGAIELIDKPLISYEGSTASGYGKQFDITLEDLYIRVGNKARLTELISASSVTSGAKNVVTVKINECHLDLGDEDNRATVMLTLLPEGEGDLDLNYVVTGGSVRMSHPRWITVQEKATYTDYIKGETGYTKLYLSSAYAPSAKVSFINEEGYSQYEAVATVSNVTEYELVSGEGSTGYGVIPDEYLSVDEYPFAVFKEGSFVGAYSTWREATSAAQNSVNSVNALNTRAEILLRRDYQNTYGTGDAGCVINSATNILIDLSGNTLISDDVGIDLTAIYNEAPYKTTVTVKNGSVKVYRGIAFVDVQSRSDQLAAKQFEVLFENVNFGFPSGATTSWANEMLFTMWSNNSPGVYVKAVYNDCTFDLKNNLPTDISTSEKLNVFHVANSYAIVDIEINGGEFITADASAINLIRADENDSMTVGYGSLGKYPTLTVYGGNDPILNDFIDEQGNHLAFSSEDSSGDPAYYELVKNELATDYGVIDAAYADTDVYPFALFKDGSFVGAYSTWSAATNAAQNAVSGTENLSSTATLILRRDFGNYNKDTGAIINKATNIVLDLCGYTFTSAWVGFDLSANYNAAPYKTTIKVKNGSVLTAIGMAFIDVQHNSGDAAKQFDVTFDNVTFGFSAGADTSWSKCMFFEMWGTNAGAGSVINATYNDCTINLRDNIPSGISSSNKFNLFWVTDGNSNANVNVRINGGEIISNDLEIYNVWNGDANDSIVWDTGKDGKMTKLTAASGTAHYSGAFNGSENELYFVEMEDDGVTSTYYLTNLKTPYSQSTFVSSVDYLSAVDYPFFVYYNGELVVAATTWRKAMDAAKLYVDAESEISVASEVYIVARRDYIVTSANGSGSNFNTVRGKIVADFMGYTMTNTENYFVDIYVNYTSATYLGFVSSIELKNGTLINNRIGSPMICIGHTGTNTETGSKEFNFIFTNVTFKVASGASSLIQEWTGGTHVGEGVDVNYVLNGCTFDYTGAAKNATFLNLANGVNMSTLVITGGRIIADDFANYSLYKMNDTDTKYLKTDEDGNFITLTQLSVSAAPTAKYNDVNGTSLSFAILANKGEYTDYVIGASIITPYGEIPYTYYSAEKYPFAVFLNGNFVGAYELFGKDATASALHNSKAAGSVILLRRDFIYAESQYNNLSQTHTGVILDLNGYTFNSSTSVMFVSQKKTKNNTEFTVKNGNVILGSKALMSLSSWDPSTGGWEAYPGGNGFIFTFENVTITLADGTSTTDVICYNNFEAGDPDQFLNITFNNCIFDLSRASKSLSLLDMTHELCTTTAVINGGKIISSGVALNLADMTGANEGSSLTFAKADGENYTVFEIPSTCEFDVSEVNDGNLVFVKISDNGIVATYRLRPAEAADLDFVPKMSLTLDRDLILNVYVPKRDFLAGFTLDGTDYTDFTELKQVTVDNETFYLISIPLSAKEAARDVTLKASVTVGDKTGTATFTFGIIKYAEKILADGTDVEKTLVCDVLSYVRAAYAYFDTDAAETIAKIDAILGESYDENNAPSGEGSTTAPSTGLSEATFVLDGTPSMRFYLAENADASAYKFYIDDVEVNTVTGTNTTGTYIDLNTYAYAVCETVTYTVNGTASGSFHIRAYYEWAKTQNDAELENLVARFWKYCQSARDYKASVVTE